jgi:WD40 repeat protein
MRRTLLAAAALVCAASLVLEACGASTPKGRTPIAGRARHDTGPKKCPEPLTPELSHTIAVTQMTQNGGIPDLNFANATSRARAVTWGGGGFLYTVGEDNQNVSEKQVRVWSQISGLADGAIPVSLSDLGDAPDIRGISANADESAIGVATLQGTALIKLEDPRGKHLPSATWYLGGPSDPSSRMVAWSPDGGHVASSTGIMGVVAVYDRNDGTKIGEFDTTAESPIEAMAYSWDGKSIAVAGNFGVRLYDANSPFTLLRALEPRRPIVAIAWGPDPNTIYTGTADGSVREVDIDRAIASHTFQAHPRGVTSIAVSGAGDMIATSGVDRQVRVWDAKTRELIDTLPRDPYSANDEDLVGTGNVEWVPGTDVIVASRAAIQLFRVRDGVSLWLRAIPIAEGKVVSVVTSNTGVWNADAAGEQFMQFHMADGQWLDAEHVDKSLHRPNIVKELVDDCDFGL